MLYLCGKNKTQKKIMKKLISTFVFLCICSCIYAQSYYENDKTGVYVGLNMGTWFPENKILGNPLFFGFNFDFKYKRETLGFNFDIIRGGLNNLSIIKFNDSLVAKGKNYYGANTAICYSYELLGNDYLGLEVLSEIGFGSLSYENYLDDKITIRKNSFIFNNGLNIRILLGKDFFCKLNTKYSIANYDLNDGVSVDLKGNSLISNITFGGCVRRASKRKMKR